VVLSGFPAYEDEGEWFPDVGPRALHRIVACELLSRGGFLTGRDLVFLRTHAELSRSECARRLGVTRRTLITWEETAAKPLPTAALNHVSIKVILARLLAPEAKLPDAALRAPASLIRKPLEIPFGRFRRELIVLGDDEPPVLLATYFQGQRLPQEAA
jgi:DNA-binding XRE family transcriptional regulator